MEPDEYDTIRIRATEPTFGFYAGIVTLRVHHPSKCEGQWCCVHNPSPHLMQMFPLLWRDDRKLMERTCPHGVGHPDPDDLAYQRRIRGEQAALAGVHGCDGCCR